MPDKKFLSNKLIICVVLTLAIVAVYLPVRDFDFISLDDPDHVTRNPEVKAGLTGHGFSWAFQETFSGNWHPLTWLSHMADCQLFGLQPGEHHLVNVGFHVANTCLLFLFLSWLTQAVWRSAFVAALFALHPLHVESVAWVSERKDVLSAFYFMLTLMAYARYALSRNHKLAVKVGTTVLWYVIALFLYALGLMSKPMLVTLPFVLLLLDYWPLQRFESSPLATSLQGLRPLLLEKIPFFLLSAASSAITLWGQRSDNSIPPFDQLPLWNRIVNSLASYWSYLVKTFWPRDLAAFYPLPTQPRIAEAGLAILLIAGVILAGWAQRKARPYIAVGFLWYLGMLVPVIGLVQVGVQAMADRYTYLPLIGILIMVTWLVSDFIPRLRSARIGLATVAAGTLAACIALTAQQVKTWKTDQSVFEQARAATESNFLAWTALGSVMNKEGRHDEAISFCSAALQIRKNYPGAWFGIGVALEAQGKPTEALSYFKEAVRLNPKDPEALDAYGLVLFKEDKLDEAEENFRKAQAKRPFSPETHLHFGMLLQKRGKINEALEQYLEARRLEPQAPEIRYYLGNAYLAQQNLDEAEREYRTAVRIRQKFVEAQVALGDVLVQKGQFTEAALHYSGVTNDAPTNSFALDGLGYTLAMRGQQDEAYPLFAKAVQVATNNSMAHLHLGMALERKGEMENAITNYERAIQLEPQLIGALNNLAWLRATLTNDALRNGAEAVDLGERACKLTDFKQPIFLGTLAAAYAEAGQFKEATSTAEKARDLAHAAEMEELARKNEQLLELYRAGKPFHEAK